MRKPLALAVLLAAASASASDNYLGTIASAGSSTTNASTASAFSLSTPGRFMVQCDAAVYVRAGTTSSVSVSSANGVKVSADSPYDIVLPGSSGFIAIIPVSGSANCKVFAVSL